MDVFEIGVFYSDSHHGGDRRKKSAQCFFGYNVFSGMLTMRSLM